MGKKDNIEEVFKDAFESFEAPVDPSVWAGVQSGMSGAGSGAAAAGTSLTAKIVGFTVAAAITTAAVVGIYQYTSSEEEPVQKDDNKELVENTTTPKEDIEAPIALEDKSTDSIKEPASKEETNTPEEKSDVVNNGSSGNANPAASADTHSPDKTDSTPDKSNDANTATDKSDATKEKTDNTKTSSDKEATTESKDEPKHDPLTVSARLENQKGTAPLTVKMLGTTNGSDLIWTVNDGNGNKVLEGNEQSFTFEESGNFLVVVEGTNEHGEKERQEFLVEVEPDVQISMNLDQAVLERDGSVLLIPNSFDKNELKFVVENEDSIDFFKMVVVDGNTQKIVFETTDISQRNWNGTNQFGEPLPAGQSYYLTIFAGDKDGNMVEPIRKRLAIVR